MRDETLIKLTAIICLTVICVVALIHRIDSVLVGTISAIVGGIAGYHFAKVKEKEEEEK